MTRVLSTSLSLAGTWGSWPPDPTAPLVLLKFSPARVDTCMTTALNRSGRRMQGRPTVRFSASNYPYQVSLE